MVRAVLTERQTSDCDVKVRITFENSLHFCFSGLHVYVPQLGWNASAMIKFVMQDSTPSFQLVRFNIHLIRHSSLDRPANAMGH